jgi:hypothetical protein
MMKPKKEIPGDTVRHLRRINGAWKKVRTVKNYPCKPGNPLELYGG